MHIVLVLALLVLQATLAAMSMQKKSCTLDETLHIGSGLRHLYWGDGNTTIGEPTFPRFVAALAVAVQGVDVELPSPTEPASTYTDLWDFGTRILHNLTAPDDSVLNNDRHRILVAARYGIVVLMLALSLAIYGFARDLLGSKAALFSLALCAMSPNLLAHGSLVTTDTSATLGFVGSMWGFWRLLQRLNWGNLLMSIGFMGILICSKITSLAVVPILLLTALATLFCGKSLVVKLWKSEHKVQRFSIRCTIMCACLVLCPPLGVGTIYSFYSVRHILAGTRTMASAKQVAAEQNTSRQHVNASIKEQIGELLNRARNAYRSDRTHPAFLDGKINKRGFRSYFPLAFLYKSSPATHLALLLAVGLLADHIFRGRKKNTNQNRRYRNGWVPVIGFITMYAILSVNTTVNIGLRHILPLYGFLFVACGAVGNWGTASRLGRFVAVAIAILAIGTGISVYPHYLAYFGPAGGGSRNGYKHLVDSNLDWGQDMILLAEYAGQRNLDIINLSRYGSDNPDTYGMKTRSLVCYMEYKPHPLINYKPGTYAISATMLQSIYYVELDKGPTTPEWTDTLEGRWQSLKPLYIDFDALRNNRIGTREFLSRHAEAVGMTDNDARVNNRMRFDRSSVLQAARPLVARFGTMTLVKFMAALRNRTPTAVLGHSIFIYDLNAEDLQQIFTPERASQKAKR
jgi:hypothetical protein